MKEGCMVSIERYNKYLSNRNIYGKIRVFIFLPAHLIFFILSFVLIFLEVNPTQKIIFEITF